MYRKHFGLSRHPFTKEIEPDELFVSNAMKGSGSLSELTGSAKS